MGIFCIRRSARVLNILESGFLEDHLASEKEKGRGERKSLGAALPCLLTAHLV